MQQTNQRYDKTIRERLGQHQLEIESAEAVMQTKQLTVEQCDELVKALREDAARLPDGAERQKLLQLAEDFRVLAEMKRIVLRKVN
jgi:hypothetical protein